MNSTKKFAFHRGYCHVLPDRLVITSTSEYINLSIDDNSSLYNYFLGIISVSVGIAFFQHGISYFYDSAMTVQRAMMFIVGSTFSIIYGVAAFATSGDNVIIRRDIKSVYYKNASFLTLVPHFQIKYRNSVGKIETRILSMKIRSGYRKIGQERIETAMRIFKEEDLLSG